MDQELKISPAAQAAHDQADKALTDIKGMMEKLPVPKDKNGRENPELFLLPAIGIGPVDSDDYHMRILRCANMNQTMFAIEELFGLLPPEARLMLLFELSIGK